MSPNVKVNCLVNFRQRMALCITNLWTRGISCQVNELLPTLTTIPNTTNTTSNNSHHNGNSTIISLSVFFLGTCIRLCSNFFPPMLKRKTTLKLELGGTVFVQGCQILLYLLPLRAVACFCSSAVRFTSLLPSMLHATSPPPPPPPPTPQSPTPIFTADTINHCHILLLLQYNFLFRIF